jgi:hypothetical protein
MILNEEENFSNQNKKQIECFEFQTYIEKLFVEFGVLWLINNVRNKKDNFLNQNKKKK